jgi:N-acetylglucosamine-6-phosphate deacetylase
MNLPHDTHSPTMGFTDLHCHGAVGYGFNDAREQGVGEAVAFHRSHGTTALVLSLVSAPLDQLVQRLHELRSIIPGIPGVVGVHLEGPFLAQARRGAHHPGALIIPSARTVDALLEAGEGILVQVTLAPELPGALGAIDSLVSAGVIVAIGHTNADADTAGAAFDRGARLLTHSFNAMAGLGHRDPGPIGAAIDREHVVLELIADGHHVHRTLIRTLFAAAPGRVALVTDAMPATGLADGIHRLGQLDVDVRHGVPRVVGSDTLAGSTLTMARAVEVAVNAGVQVDDAMAAATIVPATLLGALRDPR